MFYANHITLPQTMGRRTKIIVRPRQLPGLHPGGGAQVLAAAERRDDAAVGAGGHADGAAAARGPAQGYPGAAGRTAGDQA